MKTIFNQLSVSLLLLIAVMAGCKKDPVMYAKGIESFSFKIKDAQNVEKEYQGVITDGNIAVTVPTEADVTELKAIFKTDNPRTIVQVGTEVQESGITIHFVNEHFDEGEIIHQSKFKIDKGDDLKMLKFKIQQLEHLHFPKVIEGLIKKMKS